jgi:hypothetical protein
MFLMQLVMQLIHLRLSPLQRLPACGSNRIDTLPPPIDGLGSRAQQTAPLQSVKQRIKRTRPNSISVMRQLLHHRHPKDGLMRGMHQHMDPYKPEKEFPLMARHRLNIPSVI